MPGDVAMSREAHSSRLETHPNCRKREALTYKRRTYLRLRRSTNRGREKSRCERVTRGSNGGHPQEKAPIRTGDRGRISASSRFWGEGEGGATTTKAPALDPVAQRLREAC